MTDNEIIQALPFLAQYCKDEYNDIKADEVLLGALNIINHQQTENEALQMELEVTRDNLGDTRAELNNAETEIERLKQNLEEAHIDIREHLSEIERLRKKHRLNLLTQLDIAEKIKTEAIKEFLNKFDIEYCKMFSANEKAFMKEFKRQFLKEPRDE